MRGEPSWPVTINPGQKNHDNAAQTGMLVNDTTASSCDERVRYWNAVARLLVEDHADALWRAHSDAVNVTLIRHWLPDNSTASLLKTDLFDEALGQIQAVRAQRHRIL